MMLPCTTGAEIETSLVPRIANLPEGWEQVTDGSCGSEFRSPILTKLSDLDQIGALCELVASRGATIHDKCGLHVHVGFKEVRDLSAKYRLFRMASRHEGHFFKLCRPWAERADFCRPIAPALWAPMRNGDGFNGFKKDASGSDRYWWFNGASMHRLGTVEFRLHNGTLNPREIVGWISLLQCMFRRVIADYLKVEWEPLEPADWRQFSDDVIGHYDDALATAARSFLQDSTSTL